MSAVAVALERSRGDRRGFEASGRACMRGRAQIAAFDPPGDTRTLVAAADERELGWCSSSSVSSSIGKNSDASRSAERSDSGAGSGDEESEVESSYKGPLDALDSLEQVLPMRRGMSRFYNGKSKSFTSLADASSASSIKDVVKPENAYTRKRRNLLACSEAFFSRNHNFPLRSNGGGISKRPLQHSSRSTLALAVAMSKGVQSSALSNLNSLPLLPPPLRPHVKSITFYGSCDEEGSSPHSQQDFPPWRSFSLADLQQCVTASPLSVSGNANLGLGVDTQSLS